MDSCRQTSPRGRLKRSKRNGAVYVALTRAKDHLYVTWPLRYYHKWYALGDGHSYAQLCRFFTKDVLDSVEEVTLAAPDKKDDPGSFYDPDADIQQRMRDMWE